MYPELDVEAVIALEPDLILAPQSGLDQATFDQLSEFTDVVAYPEGPWITPSTSRSRSPRRRSACPTRRRRSLDEIDTDPRRRRRRAPGVRRQDVRLRRVAGARHPRRLRPRRPARRHAHRLGFELAPSVADLTAPEGTLHAPTSASRTPTCSPTSTSSFTWFNDETEQAATEAQPLFAAIPAFASRRLRADGRPPARHGRHRRHAAERPVGHRQVRPDDHRGRRPEVG